MSNPAVGLKWNCLSIWFLASMGTVLKWVLSQPRKKEDRLEEGFDAHEQGEVSKSIHNDRELAEESSDQVLLPVRRTSLTKMSETSIWVTGESGSIYERIWNGVQWVIAHHDFPTSAGPAVSVFIVNQTILAPSEAGNLYQIEAPRA
ncbi:hypothetical protein NE237_005819 [Protea cynaroides]|uniref:Uncharacterized protein n=1 Tax=Protea cynaroides TaxID=273540 RepID=A0A9Q0QUV3_9MAGN|nr:hypothetical protein NE237_005819 [Protea cynaroides]